MPTERGDNASQHPLPYLLHAVFYAESYFSLGQNACLQVTYNLLRTLIAA